MARKTKKHGIIIIHGVGRHEELDVLTSFSTGLIETMQARANKPGVAIASPQELTCRADLDVERGDNYVEVSWRNDEAVFRIREAYWQKAFQPQPPLQVWRWLWQTITSLMAWKNKVWLRALGAFALLLHTGQLLLGLIILRSLLRWLGRLFSLPPAWVEQAPGRLRSAVEFLFPAQYPIWVRLLAALPVAFLALALVVLVLSIRAIWQERAMPAGWTRRVPWPVGIVAVGVASWVFLVLRLETLLRGFPLGFPRRDAIAGLLGAISRYFQQDAVGDAGVFVSDLLRAASIRRKLEGQVQCFCEEGFENIHIVGHSLGSIVSFEVLARTLPQKHRKSIKTFLSVGSPLKKFMFLLDDPQAVEDLRPRFAELLKSRGLSPLAGSLGKLWDSLTTGLIGRTERRPGHRFEGLQIKDIAWHNIVADWDLAPDTLEDKEDIDLGTVVDVPVRSARKLGAHSGYWDSDCETMRYILEEIDPGIFGQELHVEIHGEAEIGRGVARERKPSRKEMIRSFVDQRSR